MKEREKNYRLFWRWGGLNENLGKRNSPELICPG